MSYKNSIFCIRPAVEVAYDLHLSAALMRACVSDDRSEPSLLRDAKDFRAKLEMDKGESWKDRIPLREIMDDKALRAPFTSSQPKKGDARHVPISVNLAMVTDFVRSTGNPWAVGERMALMVRRGAADRTEYDDLMKAIAADDQDCWAGFINFKLNELITKSSLPEELVGRLTYRSGRPKVLESIVAGEDSELRSLLYPGAPELFVSLKEVTGWKPRLLSSHFVALLDSLLRLHAFSEVRHLSLANSLLLELALSADEQVYAEDDIRQKFKELRQKSSLSSDADLNVEIERCASMLELSKCFFSQFPDEYGIDAKTSSVSAIASWFSDIRGKDEAFRRNKTQFRSSFEDGSQARQISKSSSLNNFKEFLKYVVQQRVVDTGLAGQFDQGYWAKKSGSHKSAPWKMCISPVGSLLFAGLACRGLPSCTFADISKLLRRAGLAVSKTGKGQLHLNLKSLGLIIDSPDGVGGFLVNNPFKSHL